ncbi:unnamed protein product [Acanthoscelides obtectus]|uniref:AAA+ ATPase domain-containing protein n=1 Tax=Acanthoscelides obtectus TaxID=200917 RepID=A0A9P0Q3Q3_ACAOB|nr:unnamed protein product [Acanthoscelides obtectus]CAK1668711.1 ATPase family AAA domain-containing protein 2B [Acanthoscelides obtectus]
MSLLNQKNESRLLRKVPKCTAAKDVLDFSKVGGLRHHIKTLREAIIFPLLHGHIFSHFNIKAPRGVLFYGPPGTGKTLVAGALAAEINREGIGKVTFFHRKGADMLEKWVGASENRLRALFEKATKCRPSIIFFDEIDGLAPIRSDKNDHIHSSLVATLLALMDGLDTKPGVIVIGATNRIEAVDPALRRPGRFDKELYFPLPGVEARKGIIEVHTGSWNHQLTQKFIDKLADLTVGFCGADIQALCSGAVLCCVKRQYPKINNIASKVKIEAESLKVEESDFLEAKMNIVPSTVRQGHRMRNLSHIITPLLKRQQNRVIRYIQLLWPHFLQECYKYTLGENRYAGRVLLIGSNFQGLNTHLMPSVLKHLEHLPTFVFDSKIFDKMETNLASAQSVFPAVILLSRIDEWWDYIDDCVQHSIVSTLEDIHAGLPVLTIASCTTDIPLRLHNFFYNNSTILIKIDDPNDAEREHFLAPLFFGDKCLSLHRVLENCKRSAKKAAKSEGETITKPNKENSEEIKIEEVHSLTNGKRKIEDHTMSNQALVKKIKLCENKFGSYQSKSYINTEKAVAYHFFLQKCSTQNPDGRHW